MTTGIPTPEALALLPVPAGLSVPQMDGRVCVYDNETLTPETAVDLGRREQGGRLVCARASRGCVTRAAQAALYRHAAGPNACPDCQAAPICDTGRALVRVIKVGARR
ncbi:hypothetical protein ACWCPF_31730 [Streptomyces sp. NPDC001858]